MVPAGAVGVLPLLRGVAQLDAPADGLYQADPSLYTTSMRQPRLAQVPSPLLKRLEGHLGISHPHEPQLREYQWMLSNAINCVDYCLLVISGQQTRYTYSIHIPSNLQSEV